MTALRMLAPLLRPLLWLLAALGVYGKLRADAKAKNALQAAEGYGKTRKDMDDADTTGDDPAVLREWLRARDPDQR